VVHCNEYHRNLPHPRCRSLRRAPRQPLPLEPPRSPHQALRHHRPHRAPRRPHPVSAWHTGIFYFNKADAAVIVPKRFGLGWTLNFARPTAWFYIGGLVAFLSLITVVSRWIK
jgi:hypothetical protein